MENIEKENIKKEIIISGINNRYQIKKLTQERQIMKKKDADKIEKQYFNHTNQVEYLSNAITNATLLEEHIYKVQIKHKISNYKQQDLLKKIYDETKFISFVEVIELLHTCKLNCFYCQQNVFILYELIRENKQWTLDRIDNDKGHNKDNVVISCLECNLQRKKTAKDSFFFQKNFKIIREGL